MQDRTQGHYEQLAQIQAWRHNADGFSQWEKLPKSKKILAPVQVTRHESLHRKFPQHSPDTK